MDNRGIFKNEMANSGINLIAASLIGLVFNYFNWSLALAGGFATVFYIIIHIWLISALVREVNKIIQLKTSEQ